MPYLICSSQVVYIWCNILLFAVYLHTRYIYIPYHSLYLFFSFTFTINFIVKRKRIQRHIRKDFLIHIKCVDGVTGSVFFSFNPLVEKTESSMASLTPTKFSQFLCREFSLRFLFLSVTLLERFSGTSCPHEAYARNSTDRETLTIIKTLSEILTLLC